MREYRIGRLNGRFVVTWTEDGARRRFRLDALTRKEAEAEARDLIIKETLPKGGITVADLWRQYQGFLGKRPTGITMGYTGIPILDHFGHLRPDQITPDLCEEYTASRKATGKSIGTIHTELGHLRSALAWSQKVGAIQIAPYVFRPTKPAPKDRYLTHAEIDRLLAVEAEPHIRLCIVLMLTTGGRTEAILDLTWNRVDFERGQIDLRIDATGPRKGRAVIPMNATLRAALTTAKEAALSEHVIEWAGGRIASIRTGFNRATEKAELDGVTPHTLRHTAAVHMAAAGVPMSRISQFLGHSNTAVTERVYARFAPDHLRDAATVLDFGKLRLVQ